MNLQEIDLTNIKGVLIDFDNTFYDYAPCHEAALQAVYELYKAKNEISYDDFLKEYSSAQKIVKDQIPHTGASHSRLLYFQKMIEKRDGITSIKEISHLEETYWSTFQKHMVLKKEIVDFLTKTRRNGLKICLVTDLTTEVQFRKMIAIGIETLVDFVVTSEEAGADKPDNAIFSLALEKLGLLSGQVIMIGDDKTKDIDGAQTLGIKSYMV
jgi:HAD superfamily hydrolase (TIGR01549 family)